MTTSRGFEPLREDPSRFRIYRLNHSAKMPLIRKRGTAFCRVRTCAFFRILELKSSALDHSAMKACIVIRCPAPAGSRTRVPRLGSVDDNRYTTGAFLLQKLATPGRFELPRGDPSRFLIYRLNHSAKVPYCLYKIPAKQVLPGLEPGSQDSES